MNYSCEIFWWCVIDDCGLALGKKVSKHDICQSTRFFRRREKVDFTGKSSAIGKDALGHRHRIYTYQWTLLRKTSSLHP